MTNTANTSWVPTIDSFGARLALIRWKMGWNMKTAALECGLSQASWRGWEVHGREPRGFQSIAEQIVAGTGVDQYWLMTGRERDS